MLKQLLNHWQVHREPAPFILTDDPLYCAHLSTTSSQLAEVYSVNRVNPIFEEDEDISGPDYSNHKRTHSENDTRSSDDTGYISDPRKIIHNDGDCFYDHHISSDDSDEIPKSVIVSADVHRESNPEDVLASSNTPTTSTCTYCTLRSANSSPEPYDSLTAYNDSPTSARSTSVRASMKINLSSSGNSQETEVKTPIQTYDDMDAREKIERLLQQKHLLSNRKVSIDSQTNGEINDRNPENVEETKAALMKSLNRALHQKVPKGETVENPVTKTDSTIKSKKRASADASEGSESLPSSSKRNQLEREATASVTRRDESLSTSSSTSTSRSTSNSRKPHRRYKQNLQKPITFHQLLPGHWSYDNVYLPQMSPGICYHCLHHHNPTLLPVTESDLFYPTMFHHSSRSRHSWAPQTAAVRHQGTKQESTTHSSKTGSSSTDRRYSPDGSSQETESDSQRPSDRTLRQNSSGERRSLRVPKKCKCEECLSIALEGEEGPFSQFFHAPPTCPCCYLPHRRVKFASDTDLTKHKETESEDSKLADGNKLIKPSFPINLHRLNGYVKEKSVASPEKEGISKSETLQSTVTRGKKEPIKVDDLYRSYPINFQDWEALYRRKFLLRRRKRALNMVGMAIGILLVVGVAISMTFIFLKLKRPA